MSCKIRIKIGLPGTKTRQKYWVLWVTFLNSSNFNAHDLFWLFMDFSTLLPEKDLLGKFLDLIVHQLEIMKDPPNPLHKLVLRQFLPKKLTGRCVSWILISDIHSLSIGVTSPGADAMNHCWNCSLRANLILGRKAKGLWPPPCQNCHVIHNHPREQWTREALPGTWRN